MSVVTTNPGPPIHLHLACWGGGQFGQHGHQTEDTISFSEAVERPTYIGDSQRVVYVVCGASHTVCITDKKGVYAWGNGQYGQLGCGAEEQHLSPVSVSLDHLQENGSTPEEHIVQVRCGDRHTCLLTKSGKVFTCGCNFYAQMSYDMTNDEFKQNVLIPRMIKTSHRVTEVACGQHHTLVLYDTGEVAAFGRNMYGQVGMGDENSRLQSVEVPCVHPAFYQRVVSIAAGSNHSLCIDEKGDAFCWGYGRACGLKEGHMTSPTKLTLRRIKTLDSVDSLQDLTNQNSTGEIDMKAKSIDGGISHTLILTVDGSIFGVGSNHEDQLGLGGTTTFATSPLMISEDCFNKEVVLSVSSGESYGAAVTASGHLYMWGKNNHVIDSTLPLGHRFASPVLMTKVSHTGRQTAHTRDISDSSPRVVHVACGTWHTAVLYEAEDDEDSEGLHLQETTNNKMLEDRHNKFEEYIMHKTVPPQTSECDLEDCVSLEKENWNSSFVGPDIAPGNLTFLEAVAPEDKMSHDSDMTTNDGKTQIPMTTRDQVEHEYYTNDENGGNDLKQYIRNSYDELKDSFDQDFFTFPNCDQDVSTTEDPSRPQPTNAPIFYSHPLISSKVAETTSYQGTNKKATGVTSGYSRHGNQGLLTPQYRPSDIISSTEGGGDGSNSCPNVIQQSREQNVTDRVRLKPKLQSSPTLSSSSRQKQPPRSFVLPSTVSVQLAGENTNQGPSYRGAETTEATSRSLLWKLSEPPERSSPVKRSDQSSRFLKNSIPSIPEQQNLDNSIAVVQSPYSHSPNPVRTSHQPSFNSLKLYKINPAFSRQKITAKLNFSHKSQGP